MPKIVNKGVHVRDFPPPPPPPPKEKEEAYGAGGYT
jgi:hypothetical protein